MGTRSTTLIIEKQKDDAGKIKLVKVCKFYKQFDGYPSGLGLDIANFLDSGKLVNGFSLDSNKIEFNGAGCLAGQLITNFKKGTGGVYMIPTSEGGQQYNYKIIVLSPFYKADGSPDIEIVMSGDEKFKGTPKEFIEKFGNA